MRLHTLLPLLTALASLCSARIFSGSAMEGLEEAANFQLEQRARMRDFMASSQAAQAQAQAPLKKREPIITFKNPKANEFHVDGSKLPLGMYIVEGGAKGC